MSREEEPAIGIDLGTTYSCVGVWQHGKVEIIANDQGNRTTPSVVAFTDSEHHVGEAAVSQAPLNPTNTVFDAKRLIGRRYCEESVQSDAKLWPFKVIAGVDDKPTIVVNYMNKEKHCFPEEISSMVLIKMKETAEKFLDREVTKAVVTVPAYFTDSQRQATKAAATIAGLTVLQIIDEPTAAAIAYCQKNKEMDRTGKRIALIFDLGGGTLDVSLVEIYSSGLIKVIATDGNTHLGGEDFDSRIVHHALALISQNNHLDLRGNARAIGRLRMECEKAKRSLSSTTIVKIIVVALLNGADFEMRLSRSKFEEINKDLFKKCLEPVKQCLEFAKMERSSIHDVVLVGGSTRIPKIQTMLKDFFAIQNLYTKVHAEEAVAVGAAILAAKLNGEEDNRIKDVVLMDVTPLSLGINVQGGITHVLIPRNTPRPCEKTQLYTTPEDNMSTIRIQVCEGERLLTKDNNILGEFHLRNLRMARKGAIKIEVSFKIDESGILNVSAKDSDSRQMVQITITNDAGRLSKDAIERMVQDAENYKREDERRRKEIAARNKLESYLSWIKDSIDEYDVWSNINQKSSRRSLEDTIEKVAVWTESNQHAQVFEFQDMMNRLRILWEPIRSKLIDFGVVIPDFEE